MSTPLLGSGTIYQPGKHMDVGGGITLNNLTRNTGGVIPVVTEQGFILDKGAADSAIIVTNYVGRSVQFTLCRAREGFTGEFSRETSSELDSIILANGESAHFVVAIAQYIVHITNTTTSMKLKEFPESGRGSLLTDVQNRVLTIENGDTPQDQTFSVTQVGRVFAGYFEARNHSSQPATVQILTGNTAYSLASVQCNSRKGTGVDNGPRVIGGTVLLPREIWHFKHPPRRFYIVVSEVARPSNTGQNAMFQQIAPQSNYVTPGFAEVPCGYCVVAFKPQESGAAPQIMAWPVGETTFVSPNMVVNNNLDTTSDVYSFA